MTPCHSEAGGRSTRSVTDAELPQQRPLVRVFFALARLVSLLLVPSSVPALAAPSVPHLDFACRLPRDAIDGGQGWSDPESTGCAVVEKQWNELAMAAQVGCCLQVGAGCYRLRWI